MRRARKITTVMILVICAALLSSCAVPYSAEETDRQRINYEEKYANEAPPGPKVAQVLAFLDGCVGGQYIYSAQGHEITEQLVIAANERHETYFTHGRLDYLLAIAEDAGMNGSRYPQDYAWDCSGLWWYCANALGLYDDWTDMTAANTFEKRCTPISKEELRPGDLVFLQDITGKIVHMGIVGEKGYIYEAVGGFAGVVKKRTVDRRVYADIVRGGIVSYPGWNVFGRPKIFE
jgi:cell wall-associated NlpC family hydrolase